jgi:hypothetical protein
LIDPVPVPEVKRTPKKSVPEILASARPHDEKAVLGAGDVNAGAGIDPSG